MSGSNNEITNSAGPASSTEPSMEEILASIRRILRDEQTGQDSAPEEADEDDEILVLDSSMAVKPAPEFQPATLQEPAETPTIEAEETTPLHLVSEPTEPDYPVAEDETLEVDAPAELADASNIAYECIDDEAGGFGEGAEMSEENAELVQPHGLVGEAASEAAASSIGSLIRSIGSERSIAVGRPGLTLEDLVREELRPLLKSWLDSNLPALVERIVRAEIQRVVERSAL